MTSLQWKKAPKVVTKTIIKPIIIHQIHHQDKIIIITLIYMRMILKYLIGMKTDLIIIDIYD